jgi:hypothetical protein
LAEDTELRACLEQFRKLDGAAAALPVPQMGEATGKAIWEAVTARVREGEEGLSSADAQRIADELPQPPVVSEDRWRTVWSNVRAQTTAREARPLDADLTPGPLHAVDTPSKQADRGAVPIPLWRGFMTLAAAALVLIVATVAFMSHVEETGDPDKKNGSRVVQLPTPPEALDDRYFVMVKHVPGIEEPVVCFFLKEPDPELEDFESWQ